MSAPKEHLVFVGTSDISGILRGKSFPASQWDRRSKRGVERNPTNVQITGFNTIAECPFGSFGNDFIDLYIAHKKAEMTALEGLDWPEKCDRYKEVY